MNLKLLGAALATAIVVWIAFNVIAEKLGAQPAYAPCLYGFEFSGDEVSVMWTPGPCIEEFDVRFHPHNYSVLSTRGCLWLLRIPGFAVPVADTAPEWCPR